MRVLTSGLSARYCSSWGLQPRAMGQEQCVSQNQVMAGGPGLCVMEGPTLAAEAEPWVTAQGTSGGAGAASVCIFPKPGICVYVHQQTAQLDQPTEVGPGTCRCEIHAGMPRRTCQCGVHEGKCVSAQEAFSASVCLQTKYKMGFTFGYSENIGQQCVLRCLLYVYLWCGSFLLSTTPSMFLSKA